MNSGVFVRATHPVRPSSVPQLSWPDQMRVARRRRSQYEPLAVHEVDEAGVAASRVGRDLDDAVQYAVQVQRRRDRLDDGIERLVFPLYAGQGVAAARHR